ncbi:AbrB/MazE/SpoVT family DNA-binding domain-containing protein [Candidatus Woesearchaeota archaeon]|nr:AbrB/MazE/SpoVT family DNA-binding domain-containing protein [Candidatus Woesearchaeota archaeon]
MLQFKTKVGARGQIVIPKIIRENLGITKNKTVLLELDKKELRVIPSSGDDILRRWEEISKKEGANVTKEFIYGDALYEEIF